MEIRKKGFEYTLTKEEKNALDVVFNLFDSLYQNDETEQDVCEKIEDYHPYGNFNYPHFLTDFSVFAYRVFGYDVEEKD